MFEDVGGFIFKVAAGDFKDGFVFVGEAGEGCAMDADLIQ